ncbi:MAG: hypothetical protein U1E65_14770 [Myxococcota bacterium]
MTLVDPDAALKASLHLSRADLLQIDADPTLYLLLELPVPALPDPFVVHLRGPGGDLVVPSEAEVLRGTSTSSQTAIALAVSRTSSAAEVVSIEFPGLRYSTAKTLSARPIGPYALGATAVEDNTAVRIEIDDPLSRRIFAGGLTVDRSFDGLISPDCGRPLPDDPRWVRLGASHGRLPADFSSTRSEVCAFARPSQPAGEPLVAEHAVPARATLDIFDHTYVPPVEVAPVIYQLFFDLEIPTEARCAAAKELVHSAVEGAAQASVAKLDAPPPVIELDPVDIALKDGVACRQDNERRFDADGLATTAAQHLEELLGPQPRAMVVLVYVSNLDLVLPASLVNSFNALRLALSARLGTRVLIFAIAPMSAGGSLGPELNLGYGAADEPSFRSGIADRLLPLWPLRTMLHTNQTDVPLIAAEDRGKYPYFRVCQSSKQIAPNARLEHAVLVPSDGIPSYRVALPQQVLVPSSTFEVESVSVRWAGCRSFCDHPGPLDAGDRSWIETGSCR